MLADSDLAVAPTNPPLSSYLAVASANHRRGWAPIPVGKENDGRYKLPWVKGRHGFHGQDATAEQIEADARHALRVLGMGVSGLLSLGVRLPAGVLGIDVDAYDGKNGKQTLADWEAQFGPLPDTYTVTARTDGVSGIRLYRVPVGFYPRETAGSGVEFLDHHHRYVVAPPSWHHTGSRYRVIGPDGATTTSCVLPYVSELPCLPATYLTGLPEGATEAGRGEASSAEVADFAARYDSGPQPEMVLHAIRQTRRKRGQQGDYSTRNATRDALCWAAREAKGGRYGFQGALEHIRSAAQRSYAKRGQRLDSDEFGRLVAFAVGQVRDTPEQQLRAQWDRHGAQSHEGGNGQ